MAVPGLGGERGGIHDAGFYRVVDRAGVRQFAAIRIPLGLFMIGKGKAMRQLVCFLAGVFFALSAEAATVVTVSDAKVHMETQEMSSASLSFTLTNESVKPGSIIKVTSPVAGTIELRMNVPNEDGVISMQAVESLPIRASSRINLDAKNMRVILLNLDRPLKEGDVVPFTVFIQFSDRTGKKLEATAVVGPAPVGDEQRAKGQAPAM